MENLHVLVFFGIFSFPAVFSLPRIGEIRQVNIAGSVSKTGIGNFPFFAKISNPCGIKSAPSNNVSLVSASNQDEENITRTSFFNTIEISVKRTLEKVNVLGEVDTSLSDLECNGLHLGSLPPTPLLDNMNEAETLQQTYKAGIYLATHFHLMLLDRQLTSSGENDIPDNQLRDNVPSWRFLHCPNELESLPHSLQDVITQLESVLCVVLTGSSHEERASFRTPFNELRTTTLNRYHSSCTNLKIRDCTVVREAKRALTLIQNKFNALMAIRKLSTASFTEDEMSNMI